MAGLLIGLAGAAAAAANDIVLDLSHGADPKEAILKWTGGLSPYWIHRSDRPDTLPQSTNRIGQTTVQGFTDPDLPASIFYYAVNGSCDPLQPTGYAAIPPIQYGCGFGAFDLDVTTWRLTEAPGGGLSVTGDRGVPAMTGAALPACPGGSFQVTRTDAGECAISYTLSGTFISETRWEGTFSLGFTGATCSPAGCTAVSFPAAGERALECRSDADCPTGFCRDAYCCDRDCSGACEACNRPGEPGLCGPIPAGDDPAGECPAGSTCDGTGRCALLPGETCASGADCLSGSCADGVCCDTTCEGACRACDLPGRGGVCSFVPAGQDPDVECPVGEACDGAGACDLLLGNPCVDGGDCPGGLCVDGVCCDAPCGGACQACDLPGSEGTCAPVPAGQDPDGECGAGATCDGAGGCVPVCDPVDPPRYASSPVVRYACAFGLIDIAVGAWQFDDLGGNLGVTGLNGVPRMTGAGVPVCPGGSFSVQATESGSCTVSYSLSGLFTGPDQWSGTFRVTFTATSGSCFDCSTHSLPVSGSR